jgi:DNA primase
MARDAVAEVRDRTEIVDLVSSYVQLKKTGRSWKGLCPFHQEKTPYFVVFPESGNFHCFGCGRGGGDGGVRAAVRPRQSAEAEH